jgi:multidrug efflux pump subunit AcrB
MNITEIAYRYQKLLVFIVVIFTMLGVYSYFTLPAQEDPSITIREAVVSTSYPGMSPERVELLITKKLEETLRKIPEIKEITSLSSTGSSVIHVKIQDRYFDIKSIWQNLRNKVNDVQRSLPQGTYPSVVNDEFGDVAVITMALTAEGFAMNKMYDISKHVRDSLYGVKGTKKIDVLGVQREHIYLEINTTELEKLGINPKEIARTLKSQNIIHPGGEIDAGARSFIVEPTGDYLSIEELGDTLIRIPASSGLKESVIPLKDIVTIKRDYVDPPHQTSYFNGKQAIVFAISMLDGFNVLEYSPRLLESINEIKETLPVGYNLDIATYQAAVVDSTISGVSLNVVQTLAIVLLTVILFLGIRTGSIVGSLVPLVMVITLALMAIFDIKLERMSLAALIISLGLLVDNGIVVAEDFMRRLENKVERFEALKQCGRELTVPLLISSLTTILFFMPLMMAEHTAGEYTRSLALVITTALLTSWIVAMTFTPLMSYYFIKVDTNKPKSNKPSFMDKVNKSYESFLRTVIKFKYLFVFSMFALFAFSIYSAKDLPKRFFPDSDRPQILVYTQLPAGTSARNMDAHMQEVFKELDDKKKFKFIESYSAYVGYGGPRFVLSLAPEDPADNNGFIIINIADIENQKETMGKLDQILKARFPDMFFRIKTMFLGSSDASEYKIQVVGPDADVIYKKSEEILKVLHSMPGNTELRTDWQNRILKISVKVDQQRARRAEISSDDIASSLSTYFSGKEVTQFREKDNIIPIIFRAEGDERFNIDRLRTISIYSSKRGVNVPLMQIADFQGVNQYSKIAREDMFRTVSIVGTNTKVTAQDFKELFDPYMEELEKDLPTNHSIRWAGVVKDSAEAQAALSANIPFAIGLIIVLLVGQFNSFRRPLIIMLTIPLSFIGAIWGLFISGSDLGFMVTLGLYSLAGIIINNGIVLIDRIDLERNSGKATYEAIISACVMRLRPISMSTITTILGLLTLIIPHDPLFYGLSNAIAYGLAVGTVLTLAVVPALYAIFFNAKGP